MLDSIAAEQLREVASAHALDVVSAHQLCDAVVSDVLRQAGYEETARLFDQLREGFCYG